MDAKSKNHHLNKEGRKGIVMAEWITELAGQTESFEVELLDLAVTGLPLMDEPNHPRWSEAMKPMRNNKNPTTT